MDYAQAKAAADALDARLDAASAALQGFPRGLMGLTPDDVKASPEWRQAKRAYDQAFAALRAFNGPFVKRFKSEIRADRDARRQALTSR